jgi:arylsulfatase A-like enzyme
MYPLDKLELADWLPGDEDDTYYLENFSEDLKGPRYYRVITESYGGDRELAMKSFLQAYLACVSFVDEQIQVVLKALEESSFAENTIVIMTSDHGWQMGEKSYLFKNSGWEESARIPFIVKVPGSKNGQMVEQPVSLIDIFPTLVDYCRLTGDTKLSGEGADPGGYSLRSLIEKPGRNRWEGPDGALTLIGVNGQRPVLEQSFSLRTMDWRYIRYGDGSEELYDHRNDPNEWQNLAGEEEFSKVQSDLRQQMLGMIKNNTVD